MSSFNETQMTCQSQHYSALDTKALAGKNVLRHWIDRLQNTTSVCLFKSSTCCPFSRLTMPCSTKSLNGRLLKLATEYSINALIMNTLNTKPLKAHICISSSRNWPASMALSNIMRRAKNSSPLARLMHWLLTMMSNRNFSAATSSCWWLRIRS